MSITQTALMQQRRDTAANWTSANPTLLAGEIGIESDTNKIKIGTGSASWTSLGYAPWSQVSAYPFVNADIASAAGIVDTKLATIATALKVSNSATTATNANTASAIVARDASGNFTAGTITAALTGNASTVTTNANLTGDVTSVGNATAIASGVIVNADINASAAIVDTKLATIATAGKVSNSATTATNANTASAIVARDASGNFIAGTITANLTGTASAIADNIVTSAKIVDGTIVNVDINAAAEIAATKIAGTAVVTADLRLRAQTEESAIRRNAAFSVGKPGAMPYGVGPVIPPGMAFAGIGPDSYNPVHLASGSFC